jgi:predicted NUDIX family phosphoesterase
MGKLDGSERVLCVPRWVASVTGVSPGFQAEDAAGTVTAQVQRLLWSARFLPRTEALESDQSEKQLIPYGVLCLAGKVLAYRRRPKGGDPRLRSKASLGVGGHVNPEDTYKELLEPPSPAALERCLRRELAEELGVMLAKVRLAGLLNDASDPVGAVHIGVIYVVEVPSPEVQPREVDPLGWFEPARLRDDPSLEWEGWSRILIDAGLEGMGAGAFIAGRKPSPVQE